MSIQCGALHEPVAGHPRRQIRAAPRTGAGVRHAGPDTPADGAARARSGGGPEHRRLRVRLPRLAAGHAGQGAVGRRQASGRTPRGVPARRQRGPGRHRHLGHAAAEGLRRRPLRWRVRHVVRQGPGRGAQRRCPAPRQPGRHGAAGRRADGGRRRSGVSLLHRAAAKRVRADGSRHSGTGRRQRAGDLRLRPGGAGHLALLGRMGGAQAGHRHRRIDGGGRSGFARQSRRHPGRFRHAAGRRAPARAGLADLSGRTPDALPPAGGAGGGAGQWPRPRDADQSAAAAGHRGLWQGARGSAPGAARPGPGRPHGRRAWHQHLQAGADLAAGAAGHERFRSRPGRTAGGGRRPADAGGPDQGPAVWPAGQPPTARAGQARPGRPGAVCGPRRAVATTHRPRAGGASCPARATVRHGQPHRAAGGPARAGQRLSGQVPAHAVFLLRLPAQHRHAHSGRQRGAGRHRLSFPGPAHGAQHQDLDPHGRRGRQLGRHGAVHGPEARVRQHR